MAEIGDLKWTLFPVRPEELDFFLDKAKSYGHTPGVCSACEETVDLEADPLDYYVQWPDQFLQLYGWIERGETWFGHKACLEAARPSSLPLVKMPDLICDHCGEKLTDTRISINDSTWCSVSCFKADGGLT